MERALARGLLLALFLVLVLFAFAAVRVHMYMWIFACIVVGSLLLVDVLFMGSNAFIYDPFYDNWYEKTAPKY